MGGNEKRAIADGKTFLGIELGSTRIKSVLIDRAFNTLASGIYEWENRFEDGVWTYSLEDAWRGIRESYRRLTQSVRERYGVSVSRLKAIGVSAMMHGYLVFGQTGNLLVPFRTWRNTVTERAARLLTEEFGFNIPQRWSIAHLYQAVLNGEAHLKDVAYMTTLSGYVHWRLTGKKVLGVGDASGMFPIDSGSGKFHASMAERFGGLASARGFTQKLNEIMPRVLTAGDDAGTLTADGAKLLDPSGTLLPGCRLCPPEGDAGTGMTATNSVAEHTGNVSAGTSIFAMLVLDRELSRVHTEIDMVTTPSGKPAAMVHCNNCTSDLDAWVRLFLEYGGLMGMDISKGAVYEALYNHALKGEPDCGGLVSYNYYSGEPITGLEQGRPLFARAPDSRFTLANFARCLLYSSMATLKIGMDILTEQEHARLSQLRGHGGLFKTKGVGQRLMAGALNVPVTVTEAAGEGGAWGIALLAAYRADKKEGETLEAFLNERVFMTKANSENEGVKTVLCEPNESDCRGFSEYMKRYTAGLAVQRAAVDRL